MKIIETIKTNETLKFLSIFLLSLLFNSFIIFVLLKVFGIPTYLELFWELLLYAELIIIIPYIAFFKPLIGLYAALAIELSIRKFHIGPASIRTVLLLLIIFFFLWNKITIEKKNLRFFTDLILNPVIKLSILFFLWHILTSILIHPNMFDPNQIVRVFIGIFILILCISYLKSQKSILIYIYIGIATLFLSSLVALLQKHVGGIFINLPSTLGEHDFSWQFSYLSSGRYSGFTGESLGLNYDIVNVFPLLFSIAFFYPYKRKFIIGKKIILYTAIILILYSSVLTGTRSGFYGLIIGLFFTLFFIGTKNKKLFIKIAKKIVLAVFIIFIFAISTNILKTQSFSRLKNYSDGSMQSKMSRFISGINTSKKALFWGSGNNIVEDLDNGQIHSTLKRFIKPTQGGGSAHNIFINSLLTGGLPRLFLLIIFFSLIIINILFILSKALTYEKGINYLPFFTGYSIWIIAYISDKFFHNADPFNQDLLFWFILGSMVALTRIFKKEEAATALRASQRQH